MEEKLAKLKKVLQESLEEKEVIVDDITYEKKGKYNFLTVTLDKLGGIDLDGVVDATHIIDKIVDDTNITQDSYILDVVSKERNDLNE